MRRIVPLIAAPLVLDADGLHAIGTDLDLLAGRTAPTVITPHAGEAARLLGTTTDEVAAHRLATARDAGGAHRRGLRAEGRRHDRRGARTDGSRCATATSRGSRRPAPATCSAARSRACWPAAPRPFEAAAAGAAAHLAAARSVPAGQAIVASDLIDRLRLGMSRPSPDASGLS